MPSYLVVEPSEEPEEEPAEDREPSEQVPPGSGVVGAGRVQLPTPEAEEAGAEPELPPAAAGGRFGRAMDISITLAAAGMLGISSRLQPI